MQSTGKSTETTWSDNLQNVKRQAPGRAGQTDRKEETGRPETAKNRTAPAPAGRAQTQHAGIHKPAEEKPAEKKAYGSLIYTSAGYIYFFSWLYIFSRLLIKTNKTYPQGSP